MGDFHQYPVPFPLPDTLHLPGGRTFTGGRARVYWLLRLTAERRHAHRIGRFTGPPSKVPAFLFREPWAGGQQGDRRLRDLREHGLEYAWEEWKPPDGSESSTTVYWITRDALREGNEREAQRAPAPGGAPAPWAPLAGLRFSVEIPTLADFHLDPRALVPRCLCWSSGPMHPERRTEELKRALRELWHRGELLPRLEPLIGRQVVVASTRSLDDWDGAETLAEVLIALGAERTRHEEGAG